MEWHHLHELEALDNGQDALQRLEGAVALASQTESHSSLHAREDSSQGVPDTDAGVQAGPVDPATVLLMLPLGGTAVVTGAPALLACAVPASKAAAVQDPAPPNRLHCTMVAVAVCLSAVAVGAILNQRQ
jgi:hypothetical protein